MHASKIILGLGYAAGAVSCLAQGPAPVKTNPNDVDSIDHVVAALYSVISGPAGQKRDWDRMRSLFSTRNMMAAVGEDKQGNPRFFQFDVNQYITLDEPYFEKKGFFEREIARKQERFGNIAHVFSTYESRVAPTDPKPFERGINSIQLYSDGKRWWVMSILWQGESGALKLPSRYLGR